ncbi:hypothetical protein CWI84_02270 [Idiomarina tyrosinivorans]|uniref:FAD-dependent urate hydroxylase HpyO/Asp monooxygenase CreE-like FAD/NAD(P)-binding domain-containing protein n=1 Tax=Idiomarina tyrosinivorans TaxID=1445662 RepID=A0A432ZSS6_9GAMM|nr:FAD/NAD(P)-binding protein [Idiomarina tyrosinivorans]RUO80960.1 hypothetical protein CWI84_02270 [Idiomarina tyrosinivorans]
MYDIVVLGAGASATAFLQSIKKLAQMSGGIESPLKVAVIDRQSQYGTGRVYQQDYEWLIMNTPVEDLSCVYDDSSHLANWLKKEVSTSSKYISRNLFGLYLARCLESVCESLSVHFINDTVVDVEPIVESSSNVVSISLTSGDRFQSKAIVFATGYPLDLKEDLYGIENVTKSLYPLQSNLPCLEKNEVLVFGTSLSSVDVISTCHHLEYDCKITICSRTGSLPNVKGQVIEPVQPKFCLYSEYYKDYRNKGCALSLRDILRRVRLELKSHCIDWRSYLFPKRGIEDQISIFRRRLDSARTGNSSFDLVLGMIPEIAETWALVDTSQLRLFMEKFQSRIRAIHGAIPLHNAQLLANKLDNGTVRLSQLPSSLVERNGKHIATFPDGGQKVYDHVIFATGSRRSLKFHTDSLIRATLNKLTDKPYTEFGAEVHLPSGRLCNSGGHNLYAIGHASEGSHPFMNNFGWIVKSSHMSAKAIIKKLRESTNNESLFS